MSTREMALAAYRHVLRSASVAFRGDPRMLQGARGQARQAFEEARDLADSSGEIKQGIQHAEDVARILRENVVQGVATSGDDQYKLRIHEGTEKGDNDTIKMSGQRLKEKPAR